MPKILWIYLHVDQLDLTYCSIIFRLSFQMINYFEEGIHIKYLTLLELQLIKQNTHQKYMYKQSH